MTGQTDWASAVAILVSGLILGLMFMYFFRRSKTVAADPRLDLEAKRDALLQMIRSAEGEERQRLEIEAANVLRELDRVVPASRRPPEGGRDARTTRLTPTALGFIWGVVTTLALVGLVFFVNRYSENRQQQPATAMQPAQPPADSTLQNLEAAVQRQPDDLDMRIALARAYLERDNMMGVFEQTQYVLTKSPDDSRALTYQALVRMAMGEGAAADEMLQHALKSDPGFLDASVTLAWVQTQDGKVGEAERTMQEAMRRHPQEKGRLQQVLDRMKAPKSVPAKQPQAAEGGELPPGHPPVSEAAAVPVQGIRITLDIDAAARTRSGGSGILYVLARPAGVTAGPPVAVKRLEARSFPLTVDLSSADSMMGQPLPATIRVEARLDSDGDAATKNPSDPHASQDGVVVGSAVRLTLK